MMTIDLEAIRARDALDDIHVGLNEIPAHIMQIEADRHELLAYVDALRAAAGKVTCRRCNGHGDLLQPDAVPPGWRTDLCPDCADLRRLLEGKP
jgi:hypothetical protein